MAAFSAGSCRMSSTSAPVEPAAIDKSNARVQRMFGQIAPRYDLLNHLLSLNIDRYWRCRTVRRVPPRGSAPILDICTGTGDLALAYAKAAPVGIEVVGSDFCPEMLAIAEKKRQRHCAGQTVSFIEADAQHLPFEANRFQIVSVAFGLRNICDTDAGLAEMVRVAMPGGRVAVLEFSMPTWQPFKGIYRWYFRHVLPKIGQRLARNDRQAYEYLPATVADFPSGEALVAKMQAAGLRDVAFHPLTLGVATLYVGEKPQGESPERETR
jgi:demethylmenaquinone methyltransferase/2-methoxy-6-polyprenyl-1,4-benzoquinol methylase